MQPADKRIALVSDLNTVNGRVDDIEANGAGDIGEAVNTAVSEGGSAYGSLQNTFAGKPRPTSVSNATEVPGAYDPRHQLYNFKPRQLAKTRARMASAAAGKGLAKIAMAGDSITQGLTADRATESYPARVRETLTKQGYPSGGTGFVPMAFDHRWNAGAGWGLWSTTRFAYQTLSTGNSTTLTSEVPGTIARVYYRNTNSFNVSIDDGANVKVASKTGDNIGFYEVTGLANTTHTIKITSAEGYVYILGAEVANETGLQISNFGLSGSKTGDWVSTGYADARQTVEAWNPDLVILMLGTNDRSSSVAPATYKANMQTVIDAFETGGAEIVLMPPIPSSVGHSVLAPYVDAVYKLADENDLPLIDLNDRFGSYTSANNLGMMNDATHPSAIGYQDMATGVLGAIFPR